MNAPWIGALDWLLKGGDLHILAALQSAGIAQLVEHLIRNEEVRGSNPRAGTSKHRMAIGAYWVYPSRSR